MSKKEVIWREILFQSRQNRVIKFTQKELAGKFGFSVSTVFNALIKPREAGAIRVTGRYFILEDYRKLLYLWASFRNLKKDIYYKTFVSEERGKVEGNMSSGPIWGLYSGYRFLYDFAPADYDHVYIYAEKKNLPEILERLSDLGMGTKKTEPNFFIIAPDPWFGKYPQPLPEQIFVDIWNAPEWYAKDFLSALEEKIII